MKNNLKYELYSSIYVKEIFQLAFHSNFGLRTNTQILKVFGENLRALRTEKGLSQRALFAICGIDNGMISRMENGTVNVTLNTLKALADALDVPPFRLLLEEEREEVDIGEEEIIETEIKIDQDTNADPI